MANTVVVTAATGPLGRRVCERAAADADVARVVAVDRPGSPAGGAFPSKVELHLLGLDDPEMKRLCEGADTIVHLDGGAGAADVEATRALLATAASAGVPALVVLSSAAVYGAWPANPVPLTEAAVIRPVPELDHAVQRAEIERLAVAWREARAEHRRAHASGDGPTVAVLRPALTVVPGRSPRLGPSPWPRHATLKLDDEAPMQFVHVDDVAAAVDLARRARLDGPYNVAPDGWLTAESRRDLQGPAPRLALPAPVAERIASLRWRLGLTGVPPALLPYAMHPWVVANDRLKAAGWAPTHSNEEAFVEADPGGPLTRVHPRRRQLLSLAALAVPVLAAGAGVFAVARRIVKARRRR